MLYGRARCNNRWAREHSGGSSVEDITIAGGVASSVTEDGCNGQREPAFVGNGVVDEVARATCSLERTARPYLACGASPCGHCVRAGDVRPACRGDRALPTPANPGAVHNRVRRPVKGGAGTIMRSGGKVATLLSTHNVTPFHVSKASRGEDLQLRKAMVSSEVQSAPRVNDRALVDLTVKVFCVAQEGRRKTCLRVSAGERERRLDDASVVKDMIERTIAAALRHRHVRLTFAPDGYAWSLTQRLHPGPRLAKIRRHTYKIVRGVLAAVGALRRVPECERLGFIAQSPRYSDV